jgi:tRNA(fMet)-specific endonuclease VapC
MKHLFDTDTCIQFLRRRESPVKHRLMSVDFGSVALCSIVKAELYFGAHRSALPQTELARLGEFFAHFVNLPFDDRAGEVYGRVRAQLARRGALIGPDDLLIASIALANEVTLVTHNTAEFERVEGLQIEDWQIG